MQKEIENSQEKPAIRPAEYGGKQVHYSVEVEDETLSPQLKQVLKEIDELTKKKISLMSAIAKRAVIPTGWRIEIAGVNEYKGAVNVRCFNFVELPIEMQSRPVTPLQKLTQHIDIKTLFNSGILTPDQKRVLLNVNAVMKEAEQANEKV